MNASAGIAAAARSPNIRLLVTGNADFVDAKANPTSGQPIPDFYPSINDSTHPLAHRWSRASPANVGLGPDVWGGMAGGFSAVCWYFGLELEQKLKVPIRAPRPR